MTIPDRIIRAATNAEMLQLIANDAFAVSFQSMAQYRTELLKAIEINKSIRQSIADAVLSENVEAATQAARDVLVERRRQVEKEGYEPDHDDEHKNEEIAAYAAYYAMPPGVREWSAAETGYAETFGEAIVPDGWRPTTLGDRRRELVKAGALILAEIERLDRAGMAAAQLVGGQA